MHLCVYMQIHIYKYIYTHTHIHNTHTCTVRERGVFIELFSAPTPSLILVFSFPITFFSHLDPLSELAFGYRLSLMYFTHDIF